MKIICILYQFLYSCNNYSIQSPSFMRLLLISLLFLPFALNAQSFERGDVIFGAGISLGIYGTEGFDPETNIRETDGALNRIIPLSIEFGLTNNIGIGAEVRLNKYASNKDSASAKNNDYSLMLNYHFFRTSFFNMQLGIKYGLSTFNYTNKIDLGEFNATGQNFQAIIGANFFPGEHIGFNINAGFNSLTYKDGEIKDVLGNKSDYELLLNGGNIGIGVMLKF
ncbi:MAG: hypothetical protein EYC69_05320 [Bacteroidetes bacterium]|nr:MAG: hypothetical protein EYC69_05320 [Bacteroidota bacterium]